MKINFTEEMIQTLREVYPTHGSYEVVKRLGLDDCYRYDVQQKANNLKLRRIGKYFTKEDIEFLKNNYSLMTVEDMSIKLNKPKGAIVSKASSLGLKNDIFYYSKEDEEYIKQNYGKIPVQEIMAHLNKSYHAIQTKAFKMGIKTREFWSDEEMEMMKKVYPHYSNKELSEKYFLDRTSEAINQMARKMKLKKSSTKGAKWYNRDSMLLELNKVCKELGRAPLQIELSKFNLPSGKSYDRYFGKYSNACIEAGYAPNSSIFGKSVHLMSSDGNKCLSKSEYQICEYLIEHNIKYDKEVPYKDFINDCKCGNKIVDWVIDGCFIEFFGMPEKKSYQKRIEEKRQLCSDNNIKLIELYRKDLNSLDDKLHIFHSENP